MDKCLYPKNKSIFEDWHIMICQNGHMSGIKINTVDNNNLKSELRCPVCQSLHFNEFKDSVFRSSISPFNS